MRREKECDRKLSRLDIKTPDRAQMVVDQLYHDMERRIASSPPGLCPIDMARNFLNLCHAQTCGKCVPCRIGLGQLSTLMGKILEGKGKMEDLQVLEDTARTIECTSSCAIGYHAARLVLKGLEGFRDDYIEHIQNHRCLGNLENPVPCVALCPAGVDIPGYIALIHEGRCADAVRLIRKDNPFPVACAYICEHPCEARCRRNMLDDPLNIRGLKRYAVDNAGDVPQPPCAPPTGKTVAVIGGGPGGLSAAYYLALMGHSVTVYEQRKQLGGMLRYGIPSYRFPRELLDREIASIQAEARRQADEITAPAAAQAKRESEEILARGRRAASERLERLKSAARMEGGKLELAAKQEVLNEAFGLALEKLCTLPEEAYIALLTRLVLEASSTGKEQLIFSARDRARVGKQVVVAANEALVSQVVPELPEAITGSWMGALLGKVVHSTAALVTGTGMLTLSEETRPIRGGFILVDGDMEVNCAFDVMIQLQRESLEREAAEILFGA